MSYNQAQAMDPSIRILLQVSYEALLDSHVNLEQARGSNTGVYVGHCFSDFSSHYTSAFVQNKNGYELVNGANSMAANRLSFFYDFKGPSLTIDTACSSSLMALHYAVEDLLAGKIERALVAGVSLTLNPHKNASFNAFRMLSPAGHCYAFDSRADGYCRSDGINCIVLESLPSTVSPYAYIAGTGTNSDGYKAEGITYPSANCQANLIKNVLATAQIPPQAIVFHEAHGTGTKAGDKEELAALSQVFSHEMIVGSVKSNMGHAEGASGLMGLIKILLMMEERTLYPNHDFQSSPHSKIQDTSFTILQKAKINWDPSPCTISSFGFGGSNTFAVLVPPTPTLSIEKVTVPRGTPFAASKEAQFSTSIDNDYYGSFFGQQCQIGNQMAFPYKWSKTEGEWVDYSPLVFVCDGQGSQWVNMGQDLIQNSAPFRKTMQKLQVEVDIPLVELYLNGSQWMQRSLSPIGIVSFQLGILAILREAGVQPDLFLGHSLGELACAFLAGFVTEADVIRFAQVRCKLISLLDPKYRLDIFRLEPKDRFEFVIDIDDKSKCLFVKRVPVDAPNDDSAIDSFSMNGQMAVVGCPAEMLSKTILELELEQTRVAAFNAPKAQTISGPEHEVQILLEKLRHDDPTTFIREIDTGHVAYHSEFLRVFRQWLHEQFQSLQVPTQRIPYCWRSTSQGDCFGVDYLVENICRPVYFQDAIESLPLGATVVEIGPSSGLLSQIKRTRADLVLIELIKQREGIDVPLILSKFKPWQKDGNDCQKSFDTSSSLVRLSVDDRYPRLWSTTVTFQPLRWDNFELPQTLEHPQVVYDLTTNNFKTLRDHIIRGRNLFPATGFLHALWSTVSFQAGYEILDFEIHSPLVISPAATMVTIVIHKAGSFCELWDKCGEIKYASAFIQPVSSTTIQSVEQRRETKDINFVDGSHFYPDIRRLGYEYGPSYQLVERISAEKSYLCNSMNDWISYFDAIFHLILFDEVAFSYPIGFDRIIFWTNSLSKAARWAFKPQERCIENSSIQVEGVRLEYIPIFEKKHTLHKEVFVEYSNMTTRPSAKNIAAAIIRNTHSWQVRGQLKSDILRNIVDELGAYPFVNKSSDSSVLVVSETSHVQMESNALLLTTDKRPPNPHSILIASWDELSMYRYATVEGDFLQVESWESVSKLKDNIVWKGSGSSGAVASLYVETSGMVNVISCEGDVTPDLLTKQMRQNYVLDDGRHGVWVDEEILQDTSRTPETSSSVVLNISRPGLLGSLTWSAIDSRRHTVKTKVAALNFRDVMRAMGKLKEKDLSLGLEFSGIDKKTHTRVFGVAKHALGTHCTPVYSHPTPPHLSDEAAATIPVVYLTTYYALFTKANMKEGQSVLIHAGAGGVGMAAITIAQKRGLRVFTTCSASKRDFLKAKFGLRDDQIGDSRSDAFVKTVLEGTNRRGVDVVLNQLAGPLQVASIRCLADGGNFLEIGKYDILQNTKLNQALLAANVSFHAIDLLPLLCDPKQKPMWDKILADGFAKNEIIPLPSKAFHADKVIDAFRYMSQGKHIGKIIVNGLDQSYQVSSVTTRDSGRVHLITGGLGGLGLSLACRLARNGCHRLILVGRNGIKNGWQQQKIDEIESFGCKIQILITDILQIKPNMTVQPDRVWHVATVYNDKVLTDMTKGAWDSVINTKVKGYYKLRNCWPSVPIVVFSSVAAYFGNAMQTSYALANAALDAVAREEMKTLSIRLGPLDNAGFITKGTNNRKLFEKVPFEVMSIDGVLSQILELSAKHSSGVFSIYDFKEVAARCSDQALSGSAYPMNMTEEKQIHTKNTIKTKTCREKPIQAQYTLEDAQQMIAIVLGGSVSQYKPSTTLRSAGLDSLSTMEIVQHIHEKTGNQNFKPSDITNKFTLQDMIDCVNRDIDRGGKCTVMNIDNNSNNKSLKSNRVTEEVEADNQPHQPKFKPETKKGRHAIIYVPPTATNFDELENALANTDVLVLRQQDERVFNHGAPIDSGDPSIVSRYLDRYVRLLAALEKANTIVVCVIDGEVRGGGMIFAAMADICIATPKATFGLPEIHRNMVPSVVSRALVERMGQNVVRRLSLTGESIDAEHARHLGLVDDIVQKQDLDRHIDNLLRRWKPRAKTTRFIKSELLPRLPTNALAMGTVAGQWMQHQRNLDNRNVLDVELSDGVAVLTMCDEVYQNTMTFEMTAAIRNCIPRLKRDARVVILCSRLPNFHVGLNPSRAREWKGRPTLEVAADMTECYMGFVQLATIGIPIIGVLNGRVYGGGLPIALWCDYRIATADVDIHFGNLSRGMSPAGQLSRLLQEFLTPSQIMETYLENSHWNSTDLIQNGIVSNVFSTWNQAMAEAKALAKFIAGHSTQAVRDTIHLVKVSYAADLANEEAWLIAEKIAKGNDTFRTHKHEPFHRKKAQVVQTLSNRNCQSGSNSSNVGIIAIETYTPAYAISADTLETHDIRAKTKHGQKAVAIWDDKEDSISLALNAVSRILANHVIDPYTIGRLEVGTESNVDMAKSIKSYLMSLMPSDHYSIEGVDNINACYGGTAALLNSISWCRETGKYAIVVATDTAEMDLPQSSWRGASAVAMLIGPDPWIEIHPKRTSCFKNTHDFLKPRTSTQLSPYIQTKASMDYYVHALDYTIDKMMDEHLIDISQFDAFVFHGGLCATFMKLVENHVLQRVKSRKSDSWKANFNAAREAASLMGGLYTASMYVNLVSLLSSAEANNLSNIALFSYGSGSAATLLHATVHPERAHRLDLMAQLDNRTMVSFEELQMVTSSPNGELISLFDCKTGIYYRDISNKDAIERTYHLEGVAISPVKFHSSTSKYTSMERSPSRNSSASHAGTSINGQHICWGIFALITTIFWTVSVASKSNRAGEIFHNGVLVLLLCSLVHLVANQYIKENSVQIRGSSTALVHYLLGILSFVTYASLYLYSDITFAKHWSSIIWGYYVSDNIFNYIYWDDIDPRFRSFYLLHHGITFIVTGIWALWNGVWEDYIILGVMLWLIAEVWNYLLEFYRHVELLLPIHRMKPHVTTQLKLLAFVLERAHRIATYMSMLALASFDLSGFAYFLLGTGLVMDVFDSVFQFRNLQQRWGTMSAIEQPDQDNRTMMAVDVEDEEMGSRTFIEMAKPRCKSKILPDTLVEHLGDEVE